MPASSPSSARLRARVRRILWFGARTVFTVIWWELVLRRVLGHERVNRGALERYRRIAREFRDLSVSMGGVLIKVGQFVSSRVDVLPRAITDELAGLQDQVPPEKFEDIRAVVEEELGKPLEKAFAFFDPRVEAAASLGQVHHARLLTGENVVVKVQRPGITLIVTTDLSAVRTVLGWIRNYGPIRRRVDLIALLDEFSRILYQELDYVQEAENAGKFAANFADDPDVYIPHVYRELGTRRVLVLEDVTTIKITDLAALRSAGVDRRTSRQPSVQHLPPTVFRGRLFPCRPTSRQSVRPPRRRSSLASAPLRLDVCGFWDGRAHRAFCADAAARSAAGPHHA